MTATLVNEAAVEAANETLEEAAIRFDDHS